MLFALLTLACSSVDLGEAGTFGPVLSAHWYLQDELADIYTFDGDAFTGPDPGVLDTLVLRDYAHTCVAAQSFLRRWVSLSKEALAAEGQEERCDAVGSVARHLEAQRDRYHRLNVVSEANVGTTPAEGTTDARAYVLLNADDGDACGAWNPDTCSYDEADEACGKDDVYLDGQITLRIEAGSDTSVRGTLSGDLENWESGDIASVEASFSATVCATPTLSPIVFP